MNKRTEAKAATRALILATARNMFEAEGYEAATVRKIAARAGLSTGAFFASFAGKAEAFAAIYGQPAALPGAGGEAGPARSGSGGGGLMDLQFGIEFTATVHLTSEEAGREGNASVSFGVNAIPTKEKVDELVRKAIAECNEALGVDDFRLITIGDRGFAETPGLAWVLDDEAAQ